VSPREHPDEVLVARHLDAEGRLTGMPVKRERRMLVLRHVVGTVPVGQELDEFTLNNLLRRFGPDVASLRRQLVDDGLLERPAPGRYLRPPG
jgi:hypothetical protein